MGILVIRGNDTRCQKRENTASLRMIFSECFWCHHGDLLSKKGEYKTNAAGYGRNSKRDSLETEIGTLVSGSTTRASEEKRVTATTCTTHRSSLSNFFCQSRNLTFYLYHVSSCHLLSTGYRGPIDKTGLRNRYLVPGKFHRCDQGHDRVHGPSLCPSLLFVAMRRYKPNGQLASFIILFRLSTTLPLAGRLVYYFFFFFLRV